ncbi:MBL fold metallo-hydrolase [Streptomyces sp. NPDC091204]|uniref:MBL fold metallo-hydrolase n=1 Tax=Streptomyces sp. NPDC091204 TaxID=3155299 RepID=UPI00344355AF
MEACPRAHPHPPHRTKIIPIPVLGKHAVNAYLLLGRRPVLVHAGTPGSARAIHDHIARHAVDPTDLALIVITHGHIDPFGSAAELHRLTGAPLAGPTADLEPFRTGRPACRNLAGLRSMLALDPSTLHVGHGAPLAPDRVRRWADREQRRLTRLDARGRIRTRQKS